MDMKRFIIVLFAATLAISSCSLFKEKDYTEEEKKIEAAKNDALAAIETSKKAAIQDAQKTISSATTKVVAEASADISAAINEAKKDIQASVETSVNETVDAKLKGFYDNLAAAMSIAQIAVIIGLVAVVFAIVLFLLLMRRTSRDSIIETVRESERIKGMVNEAITNYFDKDVKPYIKQGSNKVNVEAEVEKFLRNPRTLHNLVGLISEQKRIPPDATASCQATGERQEPEPKPLPRIELYAKDSSSTTLVGVTSSYTQGKSIYKLMLNSQEASIAEITICVDREEVKRRVLKSSNDLLEPVCIVDRKRNNPEDLSKINIKAGKAEKVSSDSWNVTEPIIVELS